MMFENHSRGAQRKDDADEQRYALERLRARPGQIRICDYHSERDDQHPNDPEGRPRPFRIESLQRHRPRWTDSKITRISFSRYRKTMKSTTRNARLGSDCATP